MKREHFYVSRKHPCVWLAVLSVGASASVAAATEGAWWAALSCGTALLYGLTLLLSGDELLHRTAVPVWIWGLGFAVRSGSIAAWGLALLFCAGYTFIISGRLRRIWLLPLGLAAAGGCIWICGPADCLFPLGTVLLWPAVRVHRDGKWHPTWGDRTDGRRVRTAQVMEQVTAYFMPDRTGANNLFAESVEITELERYIRRKRREGMPGFGITHAVLAAYVRTVARYPALNRFIAGQRIYSRGGDITVCMTVKKALTAEAPDSLIKVRLDPRDTAADVYRRSCEKVEEAKNEPETAADSTVAAFMMIPRLLLKFVIWLLKVLDYFGLVPRALLEISPFHGSVYFTNVGSLGIRPVFHHLYDFGTVPVFCAFGRKRQAEELHNGEAVERKYLDMTFDLDERICDGFTYAAIIKYFLRLLSHPDSLDEVPETVAQDIP